LRGVFVVCFGCVLVSFGVWLVGVECGGGGGVEGCLDVCVWMV